MSLRIGDVLGGRVFMLAHSEIVEGTMLVAECGDFLILLRRQLQLLLVHDTHLINELLVEYNNGCGGGHECGLCLCLCLLLGCDKGGLLGWRNKGGLLGWCNKGGLLGWRNKGGLLGWRNKGGLLGCNKLGSCGRG